MRLMFIRGVGINCWLRCKSVEAVLFSWLCINVNLFITWFNNMRVMFLCCFCSTLCVQAQQSAAPRAPALTCQSAESIRAIRSNPLHLHALRCALCASGVSTENPYCMLNSWPGIRISIQLKLLKNCKSSNFPSLYVNICTCSRRGSFGHFRNVYSTRSPTPRLP